MGGTKAYVRKLQHVFDASLFDPTNEPDMVYPYLFSAVKGEEWRTQKLVKELLAKHFTTQPNGLPGNEDTGTMSAWAIFSMMGLYPDCPGVPEYTLTLPTFDKVTIQLDPKYYGKDKLVIETVNPEKDSETIGSIEMGGKKCGYRINHNDLMKAGSLKFTKK